MRSDFYSTALSMTIQVAIALVNRNFDFLVELHFHDALLADRLGNSWAAEPSHPVNKK